MATTVLALACGSSEPDSKGSSNTLGSDGLECKETSTSAVAWTDSTALGIPGTLFSPFAGTCQAPFKWDASGWSDITVVPVQGQSTLTATVVIDQASARWVTRTPETCGDLLQVDGTVTLALPEGTVASQTVTLSTSNQATPTALTFTLQEASFGPWVSIQKVDPAATLAMSVQVGALARACSGQITLTYQRVSNGVGMGMAGPLATWSDSGCAVGQDKVDLGQPGQGADIAAAIATTLGQITLSGAWTGGAATTLTLATSVPGTTACAETYTTGASTVIVPVDIVANTADGRVVGLSGRGNIRATTIQGSLTQLQLWLSTDLTCASTADTLSYAAADCATVSKVTAQLGVNRYPTNPTSNGGHLEFYVYDRQSNKTGAADKMDSFVVGP